MVVKEIMSFTKDINWACDKNKKSDDTRICLHY